MASHVGATLDVAGCLWERFGRGARAQEEAMSEKDVMRIAAEASCDPRTVQKFLAGGATKTKVGERIRGAMKKLRLSIPKM